MVKHSRLLLALGIGALILMVGCGGGDVGELEILVTADGDSLHVRNGSTSVWSDAHVVVQSRQEGEGGKGRICADESFASWSPGEVKTLPACGDKNLIEVEAGGQRGQFVFYNGTLYRKLGRKEIPIS